MLRSLLSTRLLPLFLWLELFLRASCSDDQSPLSETGNHVTRRVAIIGAGSGGSSAAYYLRKHASSIGVPTNITVFERSSYIGGRSTTVNAYDDPSEPVELGASIFVEVNRNLYAAAKEFGLTLQSAGDERPQEAEDTLGVWNGYEFVFQQKSNGYYWWSIAKLIWKYGMAPIWTQRLMKRTTGNFLKMYDAPNFPFESLTDTAYELGLLDATTTTGEQYLGANNVGTKFSQEIIQASTRVNYGQNLNLIHGLETMVCMATDGAVAVEGGNWQIFSGMLKTSNANVRLNSSVTAIHRNKNSTYTVTFSSAANTSQGSVSELYDTVILAAPKQFASLDISPSLRHEPDPIPYVKLQVTLFTSPHVLSPLFFNLPSGKASPEIVITTIPPSFVPPPNHNKTTVGPAGFWSISTLRRITNPRTKEREYLYKIFSPSPLTQTFVASLLGFTLPIESAGEPLKEISKEHITWLHEKSWNSYPYLYPRITFEHLLLDADEESEQKGGLWYTSGIESFISTMETSSLMGANIAALIAKTWEKTEIEGFKSPTAGSEL